MTAAQLTIETTDNTLSWAAQWIEMAPNDRPGELTRYLASWQHPLDRWRIVSAAVLVYYAKYPSHFREDTPLIQWLLSLAERANNELNTLIGEQRRVNGWMW